MKTAKQILLEAADLIEQPGKWTRGVYAKNSGGFEVFWSSPYATSYCAIGALRRVAGHPHHDEGCRQQYSRARSLLGDVVVPIPVATFNDHHARDASEVAAKMREAAALADA